MRENYCPSWRWWLQYFLKWSSQFFRFMYRVLSSSGLSFSVSSVRCFTQSVVLSQWFGWRNVPDVPWSMHIKETHRFECEIGHFCTFVVSLVNIICSSGSTFSIFPFLLCFRETWGNFNIFLAKWIKLIYHRKSKYFISKCAWCIKLLYMRHNRWLNVNYI